MSNSHLNRKVSEVVRAELEAHTRVMHTDGEGPSDDPNISVRLQALASAQDRQERIQALRGCLLQF
jgi:hypothetical protein